MIIASLWPKYGSNIGMLARTADALGVMYVTVDTIRPFISANTGNHPIEFILEEDRDQWLKDMRAVGARILNVETGGIPINEYKPEGDTTILLLGHESYGIPEPYSWMFETVSLPMEGDSPCLNVAVAGSIAAYYFAGHLS